MAHFYLPFMETNFQQRYTQCDICASLQCDTCYSCEYFVSPVTWLLRSYTFASEPYIVSTTLL